MRATSSRKIIPATAMLVMACAPEPSPDATPAASATESDTVEDARGQDPISCVGLERSVIPAELTRSGLTAQFGQPDSVRAATEPNRHIAGATDSLFTAYYAGLEASFRKPPRGGDLISGLTVSDNRYVAHNGIGMGASEAQVTAALGPPTERSAAKLVYDCGEAAEQPVTFYLEDGLVRRISIAYYVD